MLKVKEGKGKSKFDFFCAKFKLTVRYLSVDIRPT